MANSASDARAAKWRSVRGSSRGRGRDGLRGLEFLLHGDPALPLWFFDRGRNGSQGQGSLHRC